MMEAKAVQASPAARRANVLILDNSLDMGGLEKMLYEFVANVDRSRFDVAVCCLKDCGYFHGPLEQLDVPVYQKLLRHRFDITAFARLKRIIEAHDVDVVLTFTHPNTVILSYMALMRGLIGGFCVFFHATGAADGGRLVPGFLRPMLHEADSLVAVGESHRRYLVEREKLPAVRTTVVYNGVDVSRFSPGEAPPGLRESLGVPAGRRLVTMVASLKPLKRHDVFLRAFARNLPRHDAHALIVGDGPARGDVERTVRDLGIESRVTLTGVRDDVHEILRATDVSVLSSDTEAFPVSILEAMACAVPVVATDTGSVHEVLKDGSNGRVVPRGDAAALATAIDDLLSNPRRARSMGESGRALVVERFSIEAMVRGYEDVIATSIERARQGRTV